MSAPIGQLPYSYRTLRCIQISTVYFFTFIVQEMLRYPRAGWTGFAVMMIYAGFDSGTTIFRAYHRFLGVLLGLFTGYLLWFIGHIDYRALIILIPMTVFFAYFLAGRAYSIPTVFTVNTSVIGTGYFSSAEAAPIFYFMVDYTICTMIAFGIILIFEYFWFSRYRMMQRFISDTQTEVIKDLYHLLELLNQEKIKRTEWFSRSIKLTCSLAEVNTLVHNSQFMVKSERVVGDEFNQFVALTNRIFIALKALYMAYYSKRYHKFDYYQLLQQIQTDLTNLKTYVVGEEMINATSGVLYASSH